MFTPVIVPRFRDATECQRRARTYGFFFLPWPKNVIMVNMEGVKRSIVLIYSVG